MTWTKSIPSPAVALSTYFGSIVTKLLELNATVDKFVGDAVMAYWNAPVLRDDHVSLGCSAALACAALTNELNSQWAESEDEILHTRIGLHTGYCIVGNVGSDRRLDYTVFGSTVNLASRLEALNKHYGTQILVTDRVRRECREEFLFRSVDKVLPKGALTPIEIFDLVGARPETATDSVPAATEADVERCGKWEEVYRRYLERDWDGLLASVRDYSTEYPSDPVARVYADRAGEFLKSPPADSWNGVREFASK